MVVPCDLTSQRQEGLLQEVEVEVLEVVVEVAVEAVEVEEAVAEVEEEVGFLRYISIYKITEIVRVIWLVKNLWFIIPVNP